MKKTVTRTLVLILLLLSDFLYVSAQPVSGELNDYSVYIIKNISSEYFMEVTGDILFNEKYKDHALVVQQPTSFDDNNHPNKWQRWHIIYVKLEGDVQYFSIRNAMSGKLLDVPNGVATDGIQLQQYKALADGVNDEQLWSVSEVTSGEYKILNNKSGLAITAENNTEGAAIMQSDFSGEDSQLWVLDKQELCTYRDDEVVNFFERNDHDSGSTAFDQGSSIPLSNGEVLWITQDSWDGWELTTNNLFNSNYFFNYGNSMFLQPSVTNWNPNDAPNINRENSAQDKPRQICDIQTNQTFAWPSNGVELNGRVYLNCGEGNGLSAEGQSIYEIWPKAENGLVWNSVRHEIESMSSYDKIIYSAGMVTADDGYVYVFGTRIIGFGSWFDLYVARFSQSDPLNTWTFWNGTSWVNHPPGNDAELNEAVVYHGQGASVAVSFVHGKYVVVSLDQGFWKTTDHYIRLTTSDSPISGYSAQKQVYDISEYIYGTQARYYTPNIHPEFDNGNNELLVTYSLNYSADDDQDISVNENGEKVVDGTIVTNGGYIDPYFYRVKGVRVPYSMIGIPDTDIISGVESIHKLNRKVEIYPNPVANKLYLKSALTLQKTTFRIYAANGILVDYGELMSNVIDVDTLSEGIYVLNINGEGIGMTQKFIKD